MNPDREQETARADTFLAHGRGGPVRQNTAGIPPATGATRWRCLLLPFLSIAALLLGGLFVVLLPLIGAVLLAWVIGVKLAEIGRRARRSQWQKA